MATFPTYINFSKFESQTIIDPVQDLEAISGKRNIILGEQIKETINCVTTPLTYTQNRQFALWLKGIRTYGNIELPISDLLQYKPIVTASNNIAVSGVHSIGDTSISTVGTLSSIPAGTYIQFNGETKIYQVQSTSNNTINIVPGLYDAIADATSIKYNGIIGSFRFANISTVQVWNNYYTYTFQLEENI